MDKPAILLVEADFAIRYPLAEYLRECGYRVVEAVSTDEARTLLSDETIGIDIVLSDVKSPGKLNGFELAKWIGENASGVETFLAATPAKATEKAARLCEQGPEGGKPYHSHGLLDRIKRLMAARDRTVAGGSRCVE